MKINEKILNLHPYISTEWKNVASLHVKNSEIGPLLVVELNSGTQVEVPYLQDKEIENIFTFHGKSIEEKASNLNSLKRNFPPFNFKLIPGFEQVSSVLQHDIAQSQTPDFPLELLEQVSALSKTFGVDELSSLPKPEPHCNCPHCQIMRAMHNSEKSPNSIAIPMGEKEETISEADLRFRSWDIVKSKTASDLYTVTNPLDTNEHYTVFLGKPIGCTCGNNTCEHIKAVLQSD